MSFAMFVSVTNNPRSALGWEPPAGNSGGPFFASLVHGGATVDSARDQAEPSSARRVLSPSLLARIHYFAHVPGWPNLENVAIRQRRMLRHELYSLIHVPRLKDENAAELFLGFRIGTVRSCHFAVLPIQGQGGFRRLKRFSTSPMPVGAKMVVVFKACVEHRVLLALGHAFVFAFVVVSQTDVFHCSLRLVGASSTA